MWAADKGEGVIVRMLLDHGDKGADRELISQSGQKASDIALASGHKDLGAFLDLSIKPSSEPAVDAQQASSNEAVVGELETVLLGLDLNNLIPLFQKHGMNFDTFLLIDDEDLDRIGIEQVCKTVLVVILRLIQFLCLTGWTPYKAAQRRQRNSYQRVGKG